MKKIKLNILLGIVALTFAVTLNLRHSFNDYGKKTSGFYTEALADTGLFDFLKKKWKLKETQSTCTYTVITTNTISVSNTNTSSSPNGTGGTDTSGTTTTGTATTTTSQTFNGKKYVCENGTELYSCSEKCQ